MIIRKLDNESEKIVRALSLEPDKDAVVKGINAILESLDEGKVNTAYALVLSGRAKQYGISDDEADMLRWVTGDKMHVIINVNFSTVSQLEALAKKYKR